MEAKVDFVARVRHLLYRRFRVTLHDGRILIGDFQCLDLQGNLILGCTHEVPHGMESKDKLNGLGMGTVLIPHKLQKLVELQATVDEQAALEALVHAAS